MNEDEMTLEDAKNEIHRLKNQVQALTLEVQLYGREKGEILLRLKHEEMDTLVKGLNEGMKNICISNFQQLEVLRKVEKLFGKLKILHDREIKDKKESQ